MKKDLIDTIMEKDFHTLTQTEREELKSFCASEEEYNQMKEVFVGVEQMQIKLPKPKAETKERLDDLFHETYPKTAPVWYNSVLAVVVPKEKPLYRQPLAQVAAIALLALLFIPFWSTETAAVKEKSQVAVASEPTHNVNHNEQLTITKTTDSNSQEQTSTNAETPKEATLIASSEIPASASAPKGGGKELQDSAEDHPDGVFIAVSQPASDNPEVFDLLTATF